MATADFDSDGHADIAIVDVNSDSLTVFTKLAQNTPVVINSYAVGRFPLAVMAADFNGDGKVDLISGNSSSANLTLLINDGTGHFIQSGAIPVSSSPRSIAVADFNLDSKLDLGIVGTSGQNVVVLFGDGNGGFGQPRSFNIGQQLSALISADFNVDGKPDLAVATIGSVRLLMGDGTGNFTFASSACSQNAFGLALTAGDLNGDTKPDLAVADILGAQVHVVLNDGLGCFGPPANTDVLNAGRPRSITLGDLNGDTKLDIIADTTVLLNNGSGAFGPPFFYGTRSSAEPGSNSLAADFDGDGKLDIASAGNASLSILLGDGAGGIKNTGGPSGSGVFGAARVDMNSDGKLDLVYFGLVSANIMPGDGSGGFGRPTTFTLTNSLVGPIVADFTGDSKLDVAGLDSSSQRLVVLPGDAAGSLGAAITTNFSINGTRDLGAADFNADGKMDLLTLNDSSTGSVSIFLGNGIGQFGPPTTITTNTAVNAKQIGIADFNGDGKLDLAIPSGFGFSVLLGNGTGGFGPSTFITSANAQSIVVADFNSDGKSDLAMASPQQNDNVAVLLGNGLGGFGPPTLFTAGSSAGDLTAADFNGDGKMDLGVASSSLIVVFFGTGSGAFTNRTDYRVESPGTILSGDFNSDSKIDIVASNSSINTFTVLLNTCGSPVVAIPTVQFSAPVYSVSEAGPVATITVTRSGDTSNAVSVKYATSDGIASSRSDYISAFGTLRFSPGETSKTFNVLIVDDLRVGEASESLNLTLSSPVGATLGNPSSAVLAIQENDQGFTTVNPIDNAEFFVRQHYFDFLNRVPDASGLQFWTNEITQCESLPQAERAPCREAKRINVSAAFFLSIEFQQTGYFVYRVYKTAFGDTTSPNVEGTVPIVKLNEFLNDSQELGQGVIVGQGNWEDQIAANKVAYTRQFVTTQRFLTAFPVNMSAAEFVDKLNLNAGSVLTQLERDQLVMQLGAASDQTIGRAAVLQQIAEHDLLRQREFNRAFVLMQYFGYLRRNPSDPQDTDFSGWKFWLDKLNQFNGNFVEAEMVKAFITSGEYRSRFNSSF
jgi:hypothetical protein